MKLVECVPNFSEGRDPEIIKAITDEIEAVEGAVLLDVDPGANTNRTVVTFVGAPDAVVEAAFQGIKKASQVIDMSEQTGAHPRMGATDVCPFVPLAGMTMDDCVELANRLGRRVGEELGIPVYLYEHAAKSEKRRNLANIRSGEYEGLEAKLKKPEWKPDYGEATFNASAGATVIGAREFLIAYNINLNSRNRKAAHNIALTLREKGRWARDEKGKIKRDADGRKLRQEGMFKHCKAIGWYIDEYNRAQISINFTNYKETPVHEVFEAARTLAAENGLRITGSELVGLTPKDMLLAAGRYYLEKQGRSKGVPEAELIEIAAMSLGLNEITPFNAAEKIIEYRVESLGTLASLNVQQFADEVSVDSPVPGGGSVAALCGAMSASLAAMVANLTHGKKKYRDVWDACDLVAVRGQALKDFFVRAIDLDSASFDAVLEAMRLPKKSDEEKEAREAAIQEASKGAVAVPMDTLKSAIDALEIAKEIAGIGNVNSVSDAGVAAQCGRAAAIGAAYNVLINLEGITDEEFVANAHDDATRLRARAESLADEVDRLVMEKIT